MAEYKAILAALYKSLKPGGLLVIVESLLEKNQTLSREQQVKEHEISPDIVAEELRQAGYAIVDRDDAFTRFTRSATGGFWMIRARRP
jgi:predicted methyltransferase